MDGKGSCTYSDGSIHEGIWKRGKRDGPGKFTYPNGDILLATWVDDFRSDGYGELYGKLGTDYFGCFVGEDRVGQGIAVYRNGARYDGAWQEDQWWGTGCLQMPNGTQWSGTFRRGKRHGAGTFTQVDGSSLSAEWRNDKQIEGKVTMRYKNGDTFEGLVRDEKKNGAGTYTFANGDSIEGVWKEDMLQGSGTLREGTRCYRGSWSTSPDTSSVTMPLYDGEGRLETDAWVYEGQFVQGHRHGDGSWHSIPSASEGENSPPVTESYEGQWQGDMKSGKGKYVRADGSVHTGKYENDLPEGKGLWKGKNFTFEGLFVGGEAAAGKLKRTYPETGDKYQGESQGLVRVGKGTMTYKSSKDVYEGEWLDDQRHGAGVMTLADGTVEEGMWEADEKVPEKGGKKPGKK